MEGVAKHTLRPRTIEAYLSLKRIHINLEIGYFKLVHHPKQSHHCEGANIESPFLVQLVWNVWNHWTECVKLPFLVPFGSGQNRYLVYSQGVKRL